MKPTLEVLSALAHVRNTYPDVVMVVFNKEGQWQYLTENFKAPSFANNSGPVDIGILERAADSVTELPYIYQL